MVVVDAATNRFPEITARETKTSGNCGSDSTVIILCFCFAFCWFHLLPGPNLAHVDDAVLFFCISRLFVCFLFIIVFLFSSILSALLLFSLTCRQLQQHIDSSETSIVALRKQLTESEAALQLVRQQLQEQQNQAEKQSLTLQQQLQQQTAANETIQAELKEARCMLLLFVFLLLCALLCCVLHTALQAQTHQDLIAAQSSLADHKTGQSISQSVLQLRCFCFCFCFYLHC